MAIQRYISTAFWDDAWIQELTPEEKLLFLYLITNPLTSIAGIYQITVRRMVFDTGLDKNLIEDMLKMMADCRKIYFIREEWIIIPNWTKHQRATDGSNIKKGIDAVLLSLPEEVWNRLPDLWYHYDYLESLGRPFKQFEDSSTVSNAVERRSKPSETIESRSKASNYSNSKSNTDTDTDTDFIISESADSPSEAEPIPFDRPPPVKDADLELYHSLEKAFLSRNGEKFTSWGKEGKAIKEIIKKARIRAPDAHEELIRSMLSRFWELKVSGDRFWSKQPFLPSALNAAGIWDRVLEEFREESSHEMTDEEFEQLVREAAG
jgi:hypothetical protein